MKAGFRKTARRFIGLTLVFVMLFSVCMPTAAVTVKSSFAQMVTQLTVGESVEFKVSGINYKVSWSSSDDSVARVKDGTVIGVGQGTATITAECLKKIGIWILSWYYTNTKTFEVEVASDDPEVGADGYLSAEIASLFGVSPDEYDTDGDGISNYGEVYFTSTDPSVADTDGDGIFDGDEDSDGDGLSNLSEIELGTKSNDDDTDSDGISDFEETNVFFTDPLNSDTDGDGLSDEDEVIVFAPFFPEYRVFVEHAGAKLVTVPCRSEDFQLDFEGLEKAINANTKALIINSPNKLLE